MAVSAVLWLCCGCAVTDWCDQSQVYAPLPCAAFATPARVLAVSWLVSRGPPDSWPPPFPRVHSTRVCVVVVVGGGCDVLRWLTARRPRVIHTAMPLTRKSECPTSVSQPSTAFLLAPVSWQSEGNLKQARRTWAFALRTNHGTTSPAFPRPAPVCAQHRNAA